MRIVIEPDAAAAAQQCAQFISDLVKRKPSAVLGLATGGTPVAAYKELIRMHGAGELSFADCTSFNLDEYVGLPPTHPQSYRYFMQQNLFDHIDINVDRTHVPDGLSDDIEAACESYEQQIRDAGGIDLQLLGIGSDGHIAFNEPGSSLGSRTRLKTLTRETIQDNARFFENEDEVPTLSITMGVGSILEARQCVLLATGESKADAIAGAIEGPVTCQNTASALQLHPNAVFVLDEAAASMLQRKQYYIDCEESQRAYLKSRGK